MTVNIQKMRADMALETKKMEWEAKKFALQAVAAAAACMAAGAALATLVLHLIGKV